MSSRLVADGYRCTATTGPRHGTIGIMVDWEKHAPPPGPPPGYYLPPQGYGYPPAFGMLPPHLKPSNNIGWAIAAIFTFWPLAIPAFISANKVDDLWFRGDAVGAQRASADARRYGIIALCVAGGLFLLGILWIIFVFTLFASAI